MEVDAAVSENVEKFYLISLFYQVRLFVQF